MASVQQVGGVSQFNDKQKAAIEEAVKEAQSALENDIKDAKARQPQLALVAGDMRLWAKVVGSQGSKAYVIYGTFDNALPSLGYLLAWSKPANGSDDKVRVKLPANGSDDKVRVKLPANGSDDKVYVLVGLLSEIIALTDSEIEQKLDASTSRSESGASYAQIKDVGDNLAFLTAFFA